MNVGPVLRSVRAVVFAAVCVTLSLAGHEWMSGHAVAPWAVLAAMMGVFAGAYLLGKRRRGFVPIAALMLLGEAGLHTLFRLANSPATADAWVRRIEHAAAVTAGMLHPAPPADSAWAQMPMPPGMSMPGMPAMGSPHPASGMAMPGMGHGPWGMIAAHAAAGLVCSWWLARGETMVFGLLFALVMMAFAPIRLALAACRACCSWRAPRTRIRPVAARSRYGLVLAHSVVRRGPPAPLAGA